MPRQKARDIPAEIAVTIVPVGAAVPESIPTLDLAFTTLCRAMELPLGDNLPALARLEEIQIWYANGNHAVSWQHAIMLLEQVLDTPLRS